MSTKVRSVLKNSGIAFGILGIATAFCFLVQRISESDTHVPLLFVLAVLFVSRFTDGYVYGIVASIIAVFGVNYVFTFPYFKLNFAITGYPLTFVAMLAVACSVSALTTQIKKQEQMRLEVEREKMRANLLRAVSHDIRTPLTSIVGSASGIIDNYDALSKENILELLEDMKSEGQWLVRMVENLLSITRTLKLLSRTFKLPLMESFAAASRLSALARTVFCTRVRESVLLLRASVVRFTSSPESSRADWRSG